MGCQGWLGCGWVVGCCWVPAGDAGMAGWVPQPGVWFETVHRRLWPAHHEREMGWQRTRAEASWSEFHRTTSGRRVGHRPARTKKARAAGGGKTWGRYGEPEPGWSDAHSTTTGRRVGHRPTPTKDSRHTARRRVGHRPTPTKVFVGSPWWLCRGTWCGGP